MKSAYELKPLFYDKQFIGEVLRCATLLEAELEVLLSHYFCRKSRIRDALIRVMPEISFHAKIEMLASLPIRKNTRSYAAAVGRLRAFRRLRNIVAHRWGTTAAEIEKIRQNGDISRILEGYPAVFHTEFQKCRIGVRRLCRTREFLLEDGTYIDGWSLRIDEIFG